MDGSAQNDYKSRNGIEEDLLSFAMSYSHGAGSINDAHLAGDTCSSSYESVSQDFHNISKEYYYYDIFQFVFSIF